MIVELVVLMFASDLVGLGLLRGGFNAKCRRWAVVSSGEQANVAQW